MTTFVALIHKNMNFNNSEKITKAIQQLSQYDLLKGLCHEQQESNMMPSTAVLEEIVNLCRSVLFPGYFGNAFISKQNLTFHIEINIDRLFQLLKSQILSGLCFNRNNAINSIKEDITDSAKKAGIQALQDRADSYAVDFIAELPTLRTILATDVEASYNGDPAAKSLDEVIYCYPGIRAISSFRIAHKLLVLGVPIIPRMITEMAHSETGIDIHPGASIGNYFAIDHGTGVVIGETAVIGNNVKIYQGVTLGAKSFPLDERGHPIKGIPRHPILKDNVIIYSNATILGRITIGENATVGGNIWVTENVAPNARLLQPKAKK
jgi:serine O-acetyltransferase